MTFSKSLKCQDSGSSFILPGYGHITKRKSCHPVSSEEDIILLPEILLQISDPLGSDRLFERQSKDIVCRHTADNDPSSVVQIELTGQQIIPDNGLVKFQRNQIPGVVRVTLPVDRSYCEHFNLNQADLTWSIRLSVTIVEAGQVDLFSHADFCMIFAKGTRWQRQKRK